MQDNELYYFCETDFIAEKIKEKEKLLTSNEMQKSPNGKKMRFVSFERPKKGKEPDSPAVVLDEAKLRERYKLEPYSLSSALEKAKVKYIAAYEDQSLYANILTAEKQLMVPIEEDVYENLKRQILDMSEEDREKFHLEIFGRAKTKSRGSLRTEMLKFNVRRGCLSLSRDIAEKIARGAQSSLNEEFRIWSDADTIDVSGCVLS